MDGKVLLEAVEALVKIKKVDRNMVFDALEMVLLTAYKKESGSNAKASVSLNRETGEYKIYEEKTVVDEIHEDSENAINEITVEEAKKIDRSYEAGDMLRIDVTPKNFGRVAAQAAKQVMIQKLREAERGSIYDEFSGHDLRPARGQPDFDPGVLRHQGGRRRAVSGRGHGRLRHRVSVRRHRRRAVCAADAAHRAYGHGRGAPEDHARGDRRRYQVQGKAAGI